MHAVIPRDLDAALREAGVTSWRIWRDGQDLFHVVECEDYRAMRDHLREHPANVPWQARMAELLEVADDYGGTDRGLRTRVGAAMTRPLGRGGLTVGPLSFGTAPIGNLGRGVADDEWPGALAAAWDAGVRYFDTAPHYGLGLAERRLAEGLAGRRATSSSSRPRSAGCSRRRPRTAMDDEGYAVPATHVRVRDYSRDGVLALARSPASSGSGSTASTSCSSTIPTSTTARRSTAPSRRSRSCARRASSRPTVRG